MKNLIEALTIFLKYQDNAYPTWCEHDTLHIVGISVEEVSAEDQVTLDNLGFHHDEEHWYSFRYGSA